MHTWQIISTGQFGFPQPEKNMAYLTQTYHPQKGCPTCHIGSTQINPFRFKSAPKAKHSQFLGLNWVFDELFVRESVKLELEKQGITGIRFSKPIIHQSGQPIEDIFQLHIDTVLPPSLIRDNLTIERCEMPTDESTLRFLKAANSKLIEGPFCGQEKFNFPKGHKMKFNQQAFVGQPDFVRTYEWFGSGGSAYRPMIISQKVRDLIVLNQWRGAAMEAIELCID